MAGVKVYVRFRPLNKLERSQNSPCTVAVSTCGTQCVINKFDDKPVKKFNFDYVWLWNAQQDNVFLHAGTPLVTNMHDGFNCTLFAYGQTGSGKTWSMQGIPDPPECAGLIPRMVESTFNSIEEADDTMEYMVQVSYVEIYMERIKDLMDPTKDNLKVREHKTRGIYIDKVTQPYVSEPEEVYELMEHGQMNRAVTATRMNSESSRSHAVFIFRLLSTNVETGSKKDAKLMLVDLAGSEKTRKTEASGQTLKEAQLINQSLSCLGRVISCITTGKKHIPFRDSKLTYLLSNALGGNSKTAILIAASPALYNVEETVSTLRFGVCCKSIKNKPKVNK